MASSKQRGMVPDSIEYNIAKGADIGMRLCVQLTIYTRMRFSSQVLIMHNYTISVIGSNACCFQDFIISYSRSLKSVKCLLLTLLLTLKIGVSVIGAEL